VWAFCLAQKAPGQPEALRAPEATASAAIHHLATLPANDCVSDHGYSLIKISWFTRIIVRAFIMRTIIKNRYQNLPFSIVG
jgi:hypothetical protein